MTNCLTKQTTSSKNHPSCYRLHENPWNVPSEDLKPFALEVKEDKHGLFKKQEDKEPAKAISIRSIAQQGDPLYPQELFSKKREWTYCEGKGMLSALKGSKSLEYPVKLEINAVKESNALNRFGILYTHIKGDALDIACGPYFFQIPQKDSVEMDTVAVRSVFFLDAVEQLRQTFGLSKIQPSVLSPSDLGDTSERDTFEQSSLQSLNQKAPDARISFDDEMEN